MPITIPEALVTYAKQHIGESDDLGMIQKLAVAFDDLSLGVTPASLGNIIAIAAVFLEVQGAKVEDVVAARLETMCSHLTEKQILPALGPVHVPMVIAAEFPVNDEDFEYPVEPG